MNVGDMILSFQRLLSLLLIGCCVTRYGSEAYHLHQNPCLQHEVESKSRSMADFFDSDKLFFPREYREVYCDKSSSSNSINQNVQTCAGGLYRCVTQYEVRDVLELPKKDPVPLAELSLRQIKIAVGCACVR